MELNILGVFGKNTPQERITLRVSEDCNIENFVLMVRPNTAKSRISHCQGFALCLPSLTVRKGDQVKVYFREGDIKTVKSRTSDNNLHFIYWEELTTFIKSADYSIDLFKIQDRDTQH